MTTLSKKLTSEELVRLNYLIDCLKQSDQWDAHPNFSTETLAWLTSRLLQIDKELKKLYKRFETDEEERDSINQAKKILMETQGLGEAAAYRLIKTIAMEKRVTRGKVAERIIELGGELNL